MRLLQLAVLLILMMSNSHAAVLQICPDAGHQATVQAIVQGDDGLPRRVALAPHLLPACRGLALPVAADDVLDLFPVATGSVSGTDQDDLLLHAPGAAGQFRIGSVERSPRIGVAARSAMPTGRNLLASLQVRSYGIEERASFSREGDTLLLRCDAGRHPAGLILSAPWFMTRARTGLNWKASGDGAFSLAMADAALAKHESGVVLGTLASGEGQLALPADAIDAATWQHFTLACPLAGGRLHLTDLTILPRQDEPPGRAAWVWRADAWRHAPQDVLQHAAANGIDTLFVSVPVARGAVAEPKGLASFIRAAGKAGVGVWTVDGDPHMVLAQQQNAALARVRAYAAYNRDAAPESRLKGVQFDVEHYLLPGYAGAQSGLDERYAALAAALSNAAGSLPLDLVVPFWWSGNPHLMAALAASATSVTVMDYRTDPEQIVAFAAPFLDWGVTHGKRIRIALEAGPVPAERQRRYRRATEGELWEVEVAGHRVLVLLRSARTNPHGPAYARLYERIIDGGATTFQGKEGLLREILPAIERRFSSWESFGGAALHELHD